MDEPLALDQEAVDQAPGLDPVAQWEAEFEEKLKEKAEREKEIVAQRKMEAERQLDMFYDKLTDKKAQKQAQNREHEETLKEESTTVGYERVLQLIDATAVPPEMQIMHSVLVRLKQSPNLPGRT